MPHIATVCVKIILFGDLIREMEFIIVTLHVKKVSCGSILLFYIHTKKREAKPS